MVALTWTPFESVAVAETESEIVWTEEGAVNVPVQVVDAAGAKVVAPHVRVPPFVSVAARPERVVAPVFCRVALRETVPPTSTAPETE